MQDFRKVKAWHKANHLANQVIQALNPTRCRRVPGLRSQAIRSSGSIADLIAEGCGFPSPLELARYSDMASASASECRSQLTRAVENGIIDRRTFKRLDALIDEVRAMLYSLARTIRRKHGKAADDEPDDEDQ